MHYWMPMPTENWENPHLYGQNGWWFLKLPKAKKFISMDSRFVNFKNTGLSTTLIWQCIARLDLPPDDKSSY